MSESLLADRLNHIPLGLGRLRVLMVCASVLGGVAYAQAAEDPCVGLTKILGVRGQLMQHIQSFSTKKPTAEDACSTFTNLAKVNSSTVVALERDGAWCRAPDTLADGLKGQQGQIEAAKTNACKAAAEQKKAQASGGTAARQPLGGADEILGGTMKLPQGAL